MYFCTWNQSLLSLHIFFHLHLHFSLKSALDSELVISSHWAPRALKEALPGCTLPGALVSLFFSFLRNWMKTSSLGDNWVTTATCQAKVEVISCRVIFSATSNSRPREIMTFYFSRSHGAHLGQSLFTSLSSVELWGLLLNYYYVIVT